MSAASLLQVQQALIIVHIVLHLSAPAKRSHHLNVVRRLDVVTMLACHVGKIETKRDRKPLVLLPHVYKLSYLYLEERVLGHD